MQLLLCALPEASVTIEDSSGSVIEEVTTNDEGRYTVEVSPGEYTVIAELEGYETTSSTETVEPSETTSANLPLSPSDPPEDPGSISGRVTDQNDNSLSGSSVTVEDSSGSIITKTTTGDNGQYTIEDVSPGEYTVIAEFDNKEGRAIANVESSTTKYASIVIVLDRDTPTGAITGDIISSDSNPIAGAEVKIINADTNEVVESVNTGSKGSYVFPKIEANKEYKIEASDEGYDTNSTSIINSEGTDNQDIVLTETDQETGGVKISTDAPGTVTSGNEVEVTITLTNTGSTASDSGSLEVIVPDRLSLVDVTGDGVSQPDRFYLDPISPGDSVSTTYTFKAPEDTSTGTVSLDTTGSIQIDDESYSASTTSDIEISDRGTGDVEISTDTLGTVAPGEEVEVTITTTNTGSTTAGAGGLEVTVPDRLSLVDVTGDGQNQPDRFYIDSIPSGDSVSTTYTLRAPEDASTGTVNFDVTGTLTFDDGSRSASTTTEIEISEGGLPTDPGEPEFIDVLQVIDAYNTEDVYNGVQIEFIDVLEVISAYNAG